MSQCAHQFEADPATKEVRCIICGDLDDEMQLVNKEVAAEDARQDFYKTQESFE
jgi:hypothetical protein